MMQYVQAPPPWSPQTAPPMGAFPTVHIPVPQMTLHENMQTPPFHRTFLKGKPEALGGVLIAAGILEIGLGFGLLFTLLGISLYSGYPFWGGVFYIIAGSLTVPAARRPSLCLIKGSLAITIISSVVSGVGITLTCIDFILMPFYCSYNCWYINGALAINSILVITNLLVFCVAISVAVFGCRSLCHNPQIPAQVFVIQNDFVVSPQMHQPVSQPPLYANFAEMKEPPAYN